MAMIIMLKKRKRKESIGVVSAILIDPPAMYVRDPAIESRKQWNGVDVLNMNFSVGVNM